MPPGRYMREFPFTGVLRRWWIILVFAGLLIRERDRKLVNPTGAVSLTTRVLGLVLIRRGIFQCRDNAAYTEHMLTTSIGLSRRLNGNDPSDKIKQIQATINTTRIIPYRPPDCCRAAIRCLNCSATRRPREIWRCASQNRRG